MAVLMQNIKLQTSKSKHKTLNRVSFGLTFGFENLDLPALLSSFELLLV